MKSARIIPCILAVAMIISCITLASCTKSEKGKENEGENEVKYGRYIYVSESGDDSNSGDESSPVRTLAGAVEVLRKIKSEGLPEGGVCVTFAKGNYPVTSTVTFTAADSGEAGKPIVFRGEEGAVIDGGITIPADSFSPVSEAAKAKLPTEDAKQNVLEADLAALGITDFEDTIERISSVYSIELFCDYRRQTVARYPNEGYANGARAEVCDGYARQSAPEDRVAAWANSKTIRYYGYPVYDWSSHRAYSDSIEIDTETSAILLYGLTTCGSDKPYYVYNLMEELDSPGEYYIDSEEKKLYYYPEGGIEGKKLSVTNYPGDFVHLADVSYLTFDSLTFENARGSVFYYEKGESVPEADHITFENCIIRDVSLEAICIKGVEFKVDGCEMYELGCGGVTLDTDNRVSLIATNSSVTNCCIHDFSRVYTVYRPAVKLFGYGYYCGHNEFYGSTHEALEFDCSGSIFEYNYTHDVCTETSDAGAFYSGARFDRRCNILRYNLFENIVDTVHGGGPNGIYCDDCLAETVCYGNIFNNIGGNAFAMGGGRDSKVYNNLIINCKGSSVSFDDRGCGWARAAVSYPDGIWASLIPTDYLDRLHRYVFPKNLIMAESSYSNSSIPDLPGVPANNYVCRNVSIASDYEDAVGASGEKGNGISGVEMPISAAGSVRLYGTVSDNIAYAENVGIRDIEGGDYTIAEDSPIFRDIVGFEQIPFEKIGRE